jgi:branched-chain amino acid transport system permease protein
MLDNFMILVQAPPVAVDLVVNGLLIGAIFALAAYGMALVWGVIKIINIAQGDFVILGGYVAVVMAQQGIHPLFAVPTAAAALYAMGWLLYKTVIFRIVDRDLFTSVLATYGIAILLQQLMNTVFGGDVQIASTGLGSWFFLDGMVSVAQIKVISFVLAAIVAIAFVLFLKRSRMGQAIRATAQNPRAARVLGIDTDKVFATTFALNAAICGAAGALVAMSYTIHPYIGLPYTIRSFMIVVMAGLGNIAGVIAAGLGLGAAENVAGFLLGAQLQLAFTFLLLVVVLVWRSWQLTRRREYLK